VYIKLFYFTIKLQSNIHLTYYSYNDQKDLKLNLDRTLVGQLIKIGYLLKITTESIRDYRGSADRIGKEGSHIHNIKKSADFCLEEKSAGVVSVHEPIWFYLRLKRLIEVGILKVQCFKNRTRKDLAD
jgi:hypothetical protein